MPVIVDGNRFYRTAEVCKTAGVSKNTLLRWIREKKFAEAKYRDRRGWRLFSESELSKLKNEVNRVQKLSD